MRKIISIVLLMFTIFALVACGAPPPTKQEIDCIESVKIIQDDLKDPTSMRIYGDIAELKSTLNTTVQKIYCITYDAKNGYGAYNGRTKAELYVSKDEPYVFYVTDDSGLFIGYEKLIVEAKSDTMADTTAFELTIISGEKVAEILGVEFIETS